MPPIRSTLRFLSADRHGRESARAGLRHCKLLMAFMQSVPRREVAPENKSVEDDSLPDLPQHVRPPAEHSPRGHTHLPARSPPTLREAA